MNVSLLLPQLLHSHFPLNITHPSTRIIPIIDGPLHLPASRSPPQPNGAPREQEENDDDRQNGETVARNMATLLAMRTGVKERVRVEPLSVVGEIGEGDVEKEDEDQHGETEEWVRGGGWEDDF